MKKLQSIKEKIIGAATELIINSNGNINEITTRAIAEKANTNAALINYHFRTKDNLIEICIQRVISSVVLNFKAETDETNSIKRLKVTTKTVVDFLCNNEAISRISILGDMNNPHMNDNTTNTVKGFTRGLSDSCISEKQKKRLTFMLTAIIQAVFLRKNMCQELLEFDFDKKSERDLFIDFIIDILFAEGIDGN